MPTDYRRAIRDCPKCSGPLFADTDTDEEDGFVWDLILCADCGETVVRQPLNMQVVTSEELLEDCLEDDEVVYLTQKIDWLH